MRSPRPAPRMVAAALVLVALALLVTPAPASLIVPMTDEDLIAGADVIVLGRVSRIESHLDVAGDLTTLVTVSIEEVLKGALPGGEVTVRELGGRVGDRLAWVFANAQYEVGERALLFMDQRPDGELRTYQFFMGKFTIVTDPASGDVVAFRGLPRHVQVLPPPGAAAAAVRSPVVSRPLHDLTQRIRERANEPRPPAPPGRAPRPRPLLPFASAVVAPSGTVESHQDFRFLPDPNPPAAVDPSATLLRWNQADSNQPVVMRIDANGEPLATSGGLDQVRAAMRIWSRVPTSSFRFAEGASMPAGQGGFLANGVSSIAFRDPLGQIGFPFGCSGTLAIAGISSATSSGGTTVNGRNFLRALEGDLVVADGWGGCGVFYENFANFAEVMTHELGHVLGLGHSAVTTADPVNLGPGRSGATMEAFANFDGRGAALHADDRAGVTFIYPGRTLTILKSGPGNGTITSGTDGINCGSDCVAGFAVGSTVSLGVTPTGGSTFAGFLEEGCGATVTMSVDRTCTAMFTVDPDLVMTAVSSPAIAAPGSVVTITNTVRNNGLDAGPFTVGLYLSNTSTITTLNQQLASRRLEGGLAFNQESTDATSVTIPADVPPGTYFIGAVADSDDEVFEGPQEGNNARAAATSIVIARPDLVVTALTAPATAGTGLTVSVSATVKNQVSANIAAPESTLAFYLSTDAQYDGGDLRLAATRVVPALARNASSSAATLLTIPADLPPSTYFLIARADDLEAVDEQDEANNTRATTARITVRAPDLAVTSVTAPAVAAPGASVTVTHVVRNLAASPATAGASTSRLFLSGDSVLDGGDVELASIPVGALAAGAQATLTRSVQIPADTPVGLYWVFARANALNDVVELDSPAQANNVKGTAAAVVVGPDLVVTAATRALAATAPGLSVNVTSTVRNQGGQAAGAFDVGIYLSADNQFGGDVLLATRRVGAGLAPGAVSTGVTPATIPAGTAAGTYFLIVRADDAGEVGEASEANNTLATLALQVVKPDLIVASASAAPNALAAGASTTVTYVVQNLASAAGGAPPSTSRLFFSADATLDGGDLQLGSDLAVGALAGGAKATLKALVQVPPGTLPGRYFILAVANADGAVQEADPPGQANNVQAAPILVGADLLVSAATATPAATAPGLPVNVASTVRNAGAQPAGALDVSVYLSTDAQYDDGVDALLATRSIGTGLAPGAMSAATTPVVIPGGLAAGPWFLIVRADSGGAVTEGDEANNTRAVPITVVRADLTVTAVTAPAVGLAGGSLVVSHTTRNAAGAVGGAPATTTRLHLSTDATLDGGDLALLDVPVAALRGGASATVRSTVPIPAGVAAGRYWIIAEANATGDVVEARTDNNTRATATPVVIGPDVALTAGAVTPVAAAPGQTVGVATTARNLGGQAALAFEIAFFLSTDTTLDLGVDLPLGTRQVTAGLAPLATSTATTSVVIPGDRPAGAYFVLALADSGDVNADADPSNDVRALPLTLVQPDLTVLPSLTITPVATAPGANVSVTHVVRNLAPRAGLALASVSRLFLSADATLDGGDVQLGGDVPVAALAGLTQATVTRSVQIPADTLPGLYRVFARTDAGGAVAETDEANNAQAAAASLLVGPDLVVTAATAGTLAGPGTTLPVTSTVKNQGGQAAGGFLVRFFLAQAGQPDVLLAATRAVAALAPGAVSGPLVTQVTIPSSTAPGTYFIRVEADGLDDVVEADEANNGRATGTFRVELPNLQIVSLAPPAAAIRGKVAGAPTGTVVVKNLGPGPAAPFEVQVFAARDDATPGAQVPGAGDMLFSGTVNALAPGASTTVRGPVVVPEVVGPDVRLAGNYFMSALADPAGVTQDPTPANNALTWTAKKVPVLPDMSKLQEATVDLTLTPDCGVTDLNLVGPFTVTSQTLGNPSSFAGRVTLVDSLGSGFNQVYNVTGTVQAVDIAGTAGKVVSSFTYTATIDNDFASSGRGSINGAAPALNFTGGSITGSQSNFPACNFTGTIDIVR